MNGSAIAIAKAVMRSGRMPAVFRPNIFAISPSDPIMAARTTEALAPTSRVKITMTAMEQTAETLRGKTEKIADIKAIIITML